jgi:N-acetylmuramoyl-L-alanine amidase-like protein
MRYSRGRASTGGGAVSRGDRYQADLFYADLTGATRPRRSRPSIALDEDFAEQRRPLIEGPLTAREWESVIDMLSRREADVGSPLTADADRNARLVAARIFCDRNALNLEGGDPLLCVVPDVTMGDARVRALVPHVTARGPLVDWAGLMRSVGLRVNETEGWRTRASQGQGGFFKPIGVMMHHTVSLGAAALTDIRTNIKANFFVDRSGVIHIVAGGRANHAGFGAQRVLDDVARGVAPSGTAAARGLVDRPSGNGHFYGFENENKGDGVQVWPDVQLDTMARAAAALCRRHGWTSQRVIGHAEWTRRKVDPRGVDMNTFRARVQAWL